ncbi:hypothetical protein MASR2M50_10500 [Thauera sp.]
MGGGSGQHLTAASTQEWPSTATLADGSYVVVWVSSGQDGSSGGIYGQRFANNGEALGGEFRVNTLGNGDQSWPQIAALSDGGFVVSWQDSAGNDGSGWGNFAQRFDAAGNAQGGQFVVNTTTSSTQYHANVAGYDGGFAAVWSDGSDILLQRFDNAGNQARRRGPGEHDPGQRLRAVRRAVRARRGGLDRRALRRGVDRRECQRR